MVGRARACALGALALTTMLAAFAATTAGAATRDASAGRWGGPIVAADGETVTVYASAAYASDPKLTQRTADFVASLYHGAELQQATFSLVTPGEAAQRCGGGDAGCYLPATHEIVVPGSNLADGTSVTTILAHEYGHYVAASRSNGPWSALDWGPKRWATVENVCARTHDGNAFPGDEDAGYTLNPGEAWAETYRLLNEQHLGLEPAPWILDDTFRPSAAALEAAREDVLDPWQGPTTSHWSAKLSLSAPFRPPTMKRIIRTEARTRALPSATHTVPTPLDGQMTVSLDSAPAGSTIALTDATGKLLAQGAGSVDFTICGQRSVTVSVSAPQAGDAAATVSVP